MHFTDAGKRESAAMRIAHCLSRDRIEQIRTLHLRWMSDGEIAEHVGLPPLAVWHARQEHGIDRHRE